MTTLFRRDGVSRARQFLRKAKACSSDERDNYEAFLEAAVVFGWTALDRLKRHHMKRKTTGWRQWWKSAENDDAIKFFEWHRHNLLHQALFPVGQMVYLPTISMTEAEVTLLTDPVTRSADEHYYFESDVHAVATVERHLARVEEIVAEARQTFGRKS